MSNDIETLKSNILFMAPKPFGLAFEQIIRHLYSIRVNINDSSSDGNKDNRIIEMKASRISTTYRDNTTFLNSLMTYNKVFGTITDNKYDCNIQQIKAKIFDDLYYGIYHNNGLIIFKMTSLQLKAETKIGYSNKQHRGNTDEGQFHIKKNKIEYHKENYMIQELSWEDIIQISKDIN